MTHSISSPFKRLILRTVLHDIGPIVARVLSIPDDVEITKLHDVFLSMRSISGGAGLILRASYQKRSASEQRP